MHGTNPIRPPLTGDGQSLELKHCFATLQGEGPFAGHPAVFVRLGGCNLACEFCDTDFEEYERCALPDLLTRIDALAHGDGRRLRDLVVVTGGEPLRQNIAPLCEALLGKGYRVQVETNGTLFRPLPEGVSIVCSPKASAGYAMLRPDLLSRATALKFLLSTRDDRYRDVPELGQSAHHVPVYVQPMDEGDAGVNAANLAYAATLAQERGYRLSVQLHKWLGIE